MSDSRFARLHERRAERARRREERRQNRNPLVGALMLIVVGVVLLLETQNVFVGDLRLGFETLWPLFLIAAGPGMLLGFLIGGLREPERVAAGVTTALLGWFFLAVTAGPLDYSQFTRLWPVFPLIAGIGSFAGFLASLGRRFALLKSGLSGIVVGLLGFAFTLTPLGGALLAVGWPALLVLFGLALLVKGAIGAVFRVVAPRGASTG